MTLEQVLLWLIWPAIATAIIGGGAWLSRHLP
jgi:hypothetical protein